MDKRQINSKSDVIFNIIVYSIAVITLVIIIYPLYYIIIASLSEPSAIANGRVWFWPSGFNVEGYVALLQDTRIWVAYGNTIFYALVGTLFALIVNVPVAYSLSRRDLVGRGPLMTYYIIIMFFSGGLVPTYLTVRDFGLYNTRWVLIIPFCVSIYNIIVARTFFQNSLPDDLWDSARIDGCGNLRFFFSMVLPLSKAIISVLALWTAVGQWNAYYNALIYLSRAELLPLQVILRQILIQHQALEAFGTGEAAAIAARQADLIRYAAIIVSTLPIMFFYPFVQKHFNQGVMVGAFKG